MQLIAWQDQFTQRWPSLLSDEALELWGDVEADPLGERQVRPVIDRVGLAAHVGPPAVRAAFAAAARLLLAAERAADLGARRADVDVGDPAIRSRGRKEPLGFAQVVGEDRRGQPCGTPLLQRDRLVEIAVAQDVEDRRERLLAGRCLPARALRRSPAGRRSRPATASTRSQPVAQDVASSPSNAASSISGPTSVPGSRGSPIVTLRTAA